MFFPKRRKAPKMGVRQERKLLWPQHRQYVRGFGCSVPFCRNLDIEAAHFDGPIPFEDRGGTGRSDHDKWTWPLLPLASPGHHNPESYHTLGWARFDALHAINTKAIAERMAATSPHRFKWLEAA